MNDFEKLLEQCKKEAKVMSSNKFQGKIGTIEMLKSIENPSVGDTYLVTENQSIYIYTGEEDEFVTVDELKEQIPLACVTESIREILEKKRMHEYNGFMIDRIKIDEVVEILCRNCGLNLKEVLASFNEKEASDKNDCNN